MATSSHGKSLPCIIHPQSQQEAEMGRVIDVEIQDSDEEALVKFHSSHFAVG